MAGGIASGCTMTLGGWARLGTEVGPEPPAGVGHQDRLELQAQALSEFSIQLAQAPFWMLVFQPQSSLKQV